MTREVSSVVDDLEFPEDAATGQNVHGCSWSQLVTVCQAGQGHIWSVTPAHSTSQSWLSPLERPHTLDSGAGSSALQSQPIRAAVTKSLYTGSTVSPHPIGHHHTWRRKLVYFPEVSTWLTAMISLMFIVAHAGAIWTIWTIFLWCVAISHLGKHSQSEGNHWLHSSSLHWLRSQHSQEALILQQSGKLSLVKIC